MKAQLPGIEEFQDEIIKDQQYVDRKIIRITILRFPLKTMINTYDYFINVSSIVTVDGNSKIIEASEYCGQIWKDNQGKIIEGKDYEDSSSKRIKELTDKFEALGFDVRAGKFTEDS